MNLSACIFCFLLITTSAFSQKLGKYTLEEWQTIIDTTWGEGLDTDTKLMLFDIAWNVIDDRYSCFQNLDIDWDVQRDLSRPEIEAGVSRGRFAAIMSHMGWSLLETHTVLFDTVVGWGTRLDPGIPLFVTGQPGRVTHFGAALSPLADSSLIVIKALPDHPLGLVPGDVILGYDGKPWKDLYKEILQAQFPLSPTASNVSTKKAQDHNYLVSAGMNWHLFDTLDVIQYNTADTLHYPTDLLAGQTGFVWANEQLPVPGVPWPAVNQGDNVRFGWHLGDYISWGIVEGTQTGYIYLTAAAFDWQPDLSAKFRSAIDTLMNYYQTTGLIIDLRLNYGGNLSMPGAGLELLFNSYIETVAYRKRCNSNDHFQMCSDASWPENQLAIKGVPATFYDRPIAILTGPGAHSMGDVIPLQIKFHPMSRLFGKPTAGAFSRWDTQVNHLPSNDWYFGYTDGNAFLLSDPENYLTHTELQIDEEVWLTQEDVAKGEDTVVKRAIEWMNNLSHAHDVSVNSSYLSPNSEPVIFTAKVENPQQHDLSIEAQVNSFDLAVSENFLMFDDGQHGDGAEGDNVYGNSYLPIDEQYFKVSVTTIDNTNQTSRTLPNVAWFTTKGPLILDQIYVTGNDTIVNPGDFNIKFELFLKNKSQTDTIRNVTINPVFLNPCTKMAGLSLPKFYDIAPGESKKGSRSLGIGFADSCQGGAIDFALQIMSDEYHFWTEPFQLVVGLQDVKSEIPSQFALKQNYPNPFNPTTMINYQLSMNSEVELSIYNILGQKVATLVNKKQTAGAYDVEWDASGFSSGVYIYQLMAKSQEQKAVLTKKLVLLK